MILRRERADHCVDTPRCRRDMLWKTCGPRSRRHGAFLLGCLAAQSAAVLAFGTGWPKAQSPTPRPPSPPPRVPHRKRGWVGQTIPGKPQERTRFTSRRGVGGGKTMNVWVEVRGHVRLGGTIARISGRKVAGNNEGFWGRVRGGLRGSHATSSFPLHFPTRLCIALPQMPQVTERQ